MFGIERLISDLEGLGYQPSIIQDSTGLKYAHLAKFTIPAGKFEGREVDLAIPAQHDYGQTVGSSMHIRSSPVLYDSGNVPGVRNVTASNLGPDWRYWSFGFKYSPGDTTQYLMTQIITLLRNA